MNDRLLPTYLLRVRTDMHPPYSRPPTVSTVCCMCVCVGHPSVVRDNCRALLYFGDWCTLPLYCIGSDVAI